MERQVRTAAVLLYVIENTMQELVFCCIRYECHMVYGVNEGVKVLLSDKYFSRL